MDASDALELLESKLKIASQTDDYCSNQLKKMPEGSLNVKKQKDTLHYFQRTATSGNNGRYLGKDKQELIRTLELKAYYTKLRKVAEEQEEILKKAKQLLEDMPSLDAVFMQTSAEKKNLIEPYIANPYEMTKNQELAWQNSLKKRIVEPGTSFVTQNGEHVRSKSELIIADRLKAADVPYSYECPLTLCFEALGRFEAWHPDFKVLNKRTNKIYFWEHFGLMDNPDYCADAQFKLEIYAQNNYFVGKNLIISSESSKHSLNTDYVDRLINHFLK